MKYSVIIPTLNEAKYIASLLDEIQNQSEKLPYDIEIIISDGRSDDNTVGICSKFNAKIVSSPRGRGKQLKKGADSAGGETFIFLHADLSIPKEMFLFIDESFNKRSDIAVFRMRYNEDRLLLKIYSFFSRFDSVFSTFGDQGLVISRRNYYQVGGFNDIPLMEDVEFFRKARKFGRVKKFKKYITASSRKFRERGIIKTQFLSSLLIFKYFIGVDTQKIYELYYK